MAQPMTAKSLPLPGHGATAALCHALLPCAGSGSRAGPAGPSSTSRWPAGRMVRTPWRRSWPCPRIDRCWWWWRPTTAADSAGRPGSGAGRAAAPPGPKACSTACGLLAQGVPMPTTGCWCTTRRAAWSRRRRSSADRRLSGRRGGRPAGAAAARHAQGRGRMARGGHRGPRRQMAGPDAADVPPGRCTGAGGRSQRLCRCHRRGQRHGGPGPGPLLVPGSAQNFKVTYPEDFEALAEAILKAGIQRTP
jgi:2-C-methyl-D-erythritol 4-phosphate cytidylyltransferase